MLDIFCHIRFVQTRLPGLPRHYHLMFPTLSAGIDTVAFKQVQSHPNAEQNVLFEAPHFTTDLPGGHQLALWWHTHGQTRAKQNLDLLQFKANPVAHGYERRARDEGVGIKSPLSR
jgi:hypothetical protein